MGRYEVHEVGGFQVITYAIKKSDDCWTAFAVIEQKSDANKPVAPAVRFRITKEFNREWAALRFATLQASQIIARGEIDL